MNVDVLNRDRAFIDQDADGQSESPERHDIDRLAKQTQSDERGQQRERDGQHHDQRGAQIAQKEQEPSAR